MLPLAAAPRARCFERAWGRSVWQHSRGGVSHPNTRAQISFACALHVAFHCSCGSIVESSIHSNRPDAASLGRSLGRMARPCGGDSVWFPHWVSPRAAGLCALVHGCVWSVIHSCCVIATCMQGIQYCFCGQVLYSLRRACVSSPLLMKPITGCVLTRCSCAFDTCCVARARGALRSCSPCSCHTACVNEKIVETPLTWRRGV